MLYNQKLRKIKTNKDCLTCPCFDEDNKKCLGIGKICFEYDPRTKTCVDPVTKLPIKFE